MFKEIEQRAADMGTRLKQQNFLVSSGFIIVTVSGYPNTPRCAVKK